jgi:hypothetical protein
MAGHRRGKEIELILGKTSNWSDRDREWSASLWEKVEEVEALQFCMKIGVGRHWKSVPWQGCSLEVSFNGGEIERERVLKREVASVKK